jgi:transposase
LVECGWGATRKKDCYLKRKYESLVGRRGKKKALIAVGHKIIIASYHIIKNKEGYKEPVLNNNHRSKNKQIRNYLNRLKELGIENSLMESLQEEIKGRFFTEKQIVSRV